MLRRLSFAIVPALVLALTHGVNAGEGSSPTGKSYQAFAPGRAPGVIHFKENGVYSAVKSDSGERTTGSWFMFGNTLFVVKDPRLPFAAFPNFQMDGETRSENFPGCALRYLID